MVLKGPRQNLSAKSVAGQFLPFHAALDYLLEL